MELPITKDQAFYLNTLGRTAQLYRTTNERMQRDLTDNMDRLSKGRAPAAVRPNEAADLMTAAAQIDAMTSIAYAVFPYPDASDKAAYLAHPNTVQEYLQAALTLDAMDYILIKR
jgi:hypothetical protein